MTEAPTAPAAATAAPAAKPTVTSAVTTLQPTPPRPMNPVLAEPSIFDDHFKSYDKKEAPDEKAKEAPPQPKEKAPEAKVEALKPEEKAPEQKPAPAEKAEEFKTNKDLRNAYDSTKQKASQLEAKLKEYEAKLAQSETSGKPADEKVWQDRIAAKEKELSTIQSKLAETEFTQSEDYQDKFWKPHLNSWNRAMKAVMGLQSIDEAGVAKPVSQQDAEFLLSLPDAKALAVAKQMFGDDVSALTILAAHKNRIAETQEAVNEGKAQFQKLSEERRNKEFTERQQQGELIGKLWRQGNEAMAEKSPWFKADETDPEGSALLVKGFERADKAFTEDPAMKPEDRVALHVELRNKAAAHDRLVSTVDKLRSQLEALTKERDELLDSAPKSDTTTAEQNAPEKTMTDQIVDLYKNRRR